MDERSEITTGPVLMGLAREAYLTDPVFHARAELAVQVTLGERESHTSFRRSPLSTDIALQAAVVALYLAAQSGAFPSPQAGREDKS